MTNLGLLNKWEVTFQFIGLNSLLKTNKDEVYDDENNVIFLFIDNRKVARSQIYANDNDNAIGMAKSLINESLARYCFVYHDEGFIKKDGVSIKNLDGNSKRQGRASFIHRFDIIGKEEREPKTILSDIKALNPNKKKVLNLALMYFQLGSYGNPFRLEALFSCIQVIAKYNLGRNPLNQNEKIISSEIKDELEKILKNYVDFDKDQFKDDWENCHNERNFGAHGAPSYLIDINKSNEYENISNTVHLWARRTISSFL